MKHGVEPLRWEGDLLHYILAAAAAKLMPEVLLFSLLDHICEAERGFLNAWAAQHPHNCRPGLCTLERSLQQHQFGGQQLQPN